VQRMSTAAPHRDAYGGSWEPRQATHQSDSTCHDQIVSFETLFRASVLAAAILTLVACDHERPADERSGREAARHVVFRAADGVLLSGRLWGRGARAVVLSHMGRGGDSQADWHPAARTLAGAGYVALTYNRRGVCPRLGDGCSQGSDDLAASWKDIVAAYESVRERGARSVLLIGPAWVV
jgi:hypothetical protein